MRKILPLILSMFLCVNGHCATIGFSGTQTDKTISVVGTPTTSAKTGLKTWTHTYDNSAGGNFIVIGVYIGLPGVIQVTSIAGGTTPCTFLAAVGNGDSRTELWYLNNPPSGSITFTVLLNLGSVTGGAWSGIVSLLNVDNNNPIDNSGTGTFGDVNPSTSITTTATNAWMVDCLMEVGGPVPTMTADSPQSEQYNVLDSPTFRMLCSTKGPVSPGSNTMSWTKGGTTYDGTHVVVSLAPAKVTSTIQGVSTITL